MTTRLSMAAWIRRNSPTNTTMPQLPAHPTAPMYPALTARSSISYNHSYSIHTTSRPKLTNNLSYHPDSTTPGDLAEQAEYIIRSHFWSATLLDGSANSFHEPREPTLLHIDRGPAMAKTQ